MFKQMARTSASKEDIFVFWVEIQNKMRIGGEDDLIELTIHNSFALKPWETMADIAACPA